MPLPSTRETDNTILVGTSWNALYRDRYDYERATILAEAIRAWRMNPLARRITNLYKIYNVDGIAYECKHPKTQAFLNDFWNHELNNMEKMLEQISNEIFLTGNLFVLFSVDQAGMSYVRIFPTDQISDIVTEDNDIAQEISYKTRPTKMADEPKIFPNYFKRPRAKSFMMHHTINQLAGTSWGEGEIWPDLPWLGRYASFLEDRVRLNRYRQAFMYDVALTGTDETRLKQRKAEVRDNPPNPGAVNVHGPDEVWTVISAKLDSGDAEKDGLMLKKMIAVNHGPLHYFTEPESSTRTTADAAGTPAFKAFENHQQTFKAILKSILTTALRRRALIDDAVDPDAQIKITAADASERDNAALALATTQIVSSIGEMFDRKLIDEKEFMRLVYRFAGEQLDPDKIAKGTRKPLYTPGQAQRAGIKTDAETGETKTKGTDE